MDPHTAGLARNLNSSRLSAHGAGWSCSQRAEIDGLYRPGYKRRRMWWFLPRILWASRNDPLARWVADPTNGERKRWLAAQRARPGKGFDPSLRVSRHTGQDEVSFLMLGDPGEGDDSQYHLVRPLEARAQGVSFVYIVSDVIYPSGDVLDYQDKFLHPYRNLPGPIYAIPGNHDWYDDLHGFMALLCDADPDLRPPVEQRVNWWRRLLLATLWRQVPKAKQRERIETMRRVQGTLRPEPSGQPGPYFAIELKDLLLVGIDTGIRGELDDEQGRWLREVSAVPKDKILITGKPLVVNAERKTIGIIGSLESVNDIVDDPAHRYIAVVGGDTHNYQRYPARQPDGRILQHIVTGAGGAYTKATHTIPRVTVENSGCDETDFRCYPLRGDSLATYSILFDRRFGLGKGRLVIPPAEAAAIMACRIDGHPRPIRDPDGDVAISPRARRAANFVYPMSKWSGPFFRFFSEFLDWNTPDPPLFKSFLRVDVRPGEIEIRGYAATGCAEHASNPPLEDHILGRRISDGLWEWENKTVGMLTTTPAS